MIHLLILIVRTIFHVVHKFIFRPKELEEVVEMVEKVTQSKEQLPHRENSRPCPSCGKPLDIGEYHPSPSTNPRCLGRPIRKPFTCPNTKTTADCVHPNWGHCTDCGQLYGFGGGYGAHAQRECPGKVLP